MSRYEFEWDDKQAQAVQDVLMTKAESATEGRLFFNNVAQRIEEQKPAPLPTKRLAMIREKGSGLEYVVLSCTRADGRPDWYGPVDGLNIGGWVDPEELPKDFEVLFEGVDL